jgi:peptidoglycan/xylan/chitin deacetylase (PgdA/CDA1 family)
MIKRLVKLGFSLGVRAWDAVRDCACRCLGRPLAPRGVVIYYHAIQRHQRSRFARQMDELLNGAQPFRAECSGALTQEGLHVAVTFDDGFISVVENALPELKKRNIPFTFFVPTGSLGRRPSWIQDQAHSSWEERVLSLEELRALATEPLATIGSHSISHSNFLKLNSRDALHEFRRSKADLESALKREVTLFSYPHGAHNERLDEQARQSGYQHVFTVEPALVRPEAQQVAVGRVSVDPGDWPLEFRLKLAGAYRWESSLRAVKARFGRKPQAAS